MAAERATPPFDPIALSERPMTPLEAELLNSTTVVCVNRTSVVNATETFVHCFEPWTNEGQARFALGVVGTILILLSILTLFGAGGAAKQAPDDAEMANSRSVDLGAYGEAGKGGDGAFAAVKVLSPVAWAWLGVRSGPEVAYYCRRLRTRSRAPICSGSR